MREQAVDGRAACPAECWQKRFAVKRNSDSSAEGMVTYSRNPKLKDPDNSYFLQLVTQKGVDRER